MYDVIIIGRGPAGISAALYTVRANLKTLVIGSCDSALRKASKIENYYGFAEIISGENLFKEGEKQAIRLGTELVEGEVISVTKQDYFEVEATPGKYSSRAIILATGQQQNKINIENLAGFEGKGVSYCTTCDGFFYRGLKVGVLGYRDFAIHEASELLAFTGDVTIFTNGMELELSKEYSEGLSHFKINKKKLLKLDGTEFLERVFFEDGSSQELDGIFVAFESASSMDFARKLGIMVDNGAIVVDREQRTNLEGLFAAGDCTGIFKQVSIAVGQGALAGRKAIEYLRSL